MKFPIICREPFHASPVVVYEFEYVQTADGTRAWFIFDTGTEFHRTDDRGSLEALPPGSDVTYRQRVHWQCSCGLNTTLKRDTAHAILDQLVDGGASEIELRRLDAIVSKWR